MSLLLVILDTSSYFHFKSKIEVLRETTGPSHWDAHVLATGGTLEHLLGTTFLYRRMYTLLTEGVPVIHVVEFLDDCGNNVVSSPHSFTCYGIHLSPWLSTWNFC
ncbi:hypothetical protein EMCRGX_G000884 [Ephydatia muelleri]